MRKKVEETCWEQVWKKVEEEAWEQVENMVEEKGRGKRLLELPGHFGQIVLVYACAGIRAKTMNLIKFDQS